ncbi:MAG: hypothetical protein ACLPIG_15105 [Methylocella sp.]
MSPKAAVSVMVRQDRREAPIVMGRSVSLHHKTNQTNLHQVKVKPFVSNEKSISANGSQSLQLKIK